VQVDEGEQGRGKSGLRAWLSRMGETEAGQASCPVLGGGGGIPQVLAEGPDKTPGWSHRWSERGGARRLSGRVCR